jgi:hypothetical protein
LAANELSIQIENVEQEDHPDQENSIKQIEVEETGPGQRIESQENANADSPSLYCICLCHHKNPVYEIISGTTTKRQQNEQAIVSPHFHKAETIEPTTFKKDVAVQCSSQLVDFLVTPMAERLRLQQSLSQGMLLQEEEEKQTTKEQFPQA